MTVTVNMSGTLPTINRADLTLEENKVYIIPLNQLGVSSSMAALPTAGNGTSMGLVAGTHGTAPPVLKGSDSGGNASPVPETCRFQWSLPPEYVSGQPIEVRVRGGMLTTVADTAATVDVECYKQDRDGSIGSELCTTSATSINSLTMADKDFTITPTGLAAGDVLDIELTTSITDSGDLGVMQATITEVAMKIDIKG